MTVSFPPLAAVSLVLTYGLYAAFALLSFLFVSRFIPETNGMSLEEANALLPPKGSANAGAATAKKDSARG